MNLQALLQTRYLGHLLSTREGRAHVLNQVADAESNGEAAVFDRALAFVDDPSLQKMIKKHRDDEIRHGELFRACRDAQGIDVGAPPAHLRLIDRVDRALGGILDAPIRDGADVMRLYLLLEVIEERALATFAVMEPAFRKVDPATANVFRQVSDDEERHLKYCHAISRRYAPSDAALDAARKELRAIELRCFQENARANMAHHFAHGMTGLGPVRRAAWSGAARIAQAIATRRLEAAAA